MLDPTPKPAGNEPGPKPFGIPGRFLTISQAARLLGVSTGTLRNWDRAGKLKAYRNVWTAYRLYDRRELEALRPQ